VRWADRHRWQGRERHRASLDQHSDADTSAQLVELSAQLTILHLQAHHPLLKLPGPGRLRVCLLLRLHAVTIARSHVSLPLPAYHTA
jgi:hypothetical protein